jgi:hypothetical protein
LSVKAIKEDEEDVALQAVEFWSTLCDYELELEEEGEAAEEVRVCVVDTRQKGRESSANAGARGEGEVLSVASGRLRGCRGSACFFSVSSPHF